jgi:hypothetical protein
MIMSNRRRLARERPQVYPVIAFPLANANNENDSIDAI